jgi:hypothetical protein
MTILLRTDSTVLAELLGLCAPPAAAGEARLPLGTMAPLAAGKPGRAEPKRGPILRDRLLRDRSFAGKNLEGADFEGSDLRGCDFRGADLFGARLRRADLRGTLFDMTGILEIWVPPNLPAETVNQIRYFDFAHVMARDLDFEPTPAPLPCPYREAALRPVLYEWGSKTWRGGARWAAPKSPWTLEEIIAEVLSAIGCRHDFRRPLERARARRKRSRASASPS